MKVLISNPPAIDKKRFTREGRCTQEIGVWATLWPPISIAMIGSVLERAGHKVKLLDCPAQNLDIAGFRQLLSSFRPQIVLWSSATPSIDSDLYLAKIVKQEVPSVRTGLFGTHVTVLAELCMQLSHEVDFIIRGEPEFTIKELVEILDEGKDISSIAGLTFRDSANGVRHNRDREFIDPLDELPTPAWHLLDLSHYRLPSSGRPFLIIAPSRGCPYSCTFCTSRTYYGRKIRRRSVGLVIEEIKENIGKYHISDFFFWADTFTADPAYTYQLCEKIIDQGIKIRWTCNSRVDTINPDLLKLMRKAGCWMISFGFESGDQKVLDAARKNTTVEKGIQAVRWSEEASLKVAGHFVLGLPGDSKEGIRKTINLAASLKLDVVQFYTAVPFPGSQLYQMAEECGWLLHNEFQNFRQNLAVMDLPGLSACEINKWRIWAYLRCYLHPGMGWRSVKMLDMKNVAHIMGSLRHYLRWMVFK